MEQFSTRRHDTESATHNFMESSTFERLIGAPHLNIASFIPLHDQAVYQALVRECASRIAGRPEDAAIIAADPATARFISDSCAHLPESVSQIVLKASGNSASTHTTRNPAERPEFAFLCIAPTMTLALLGMSTATSGEDRFVGGWSIRHTNAIGLLEHLERGGEITPEVIETARRIPEPSDTDLSTLAMDLMAAHARVQADQHESMAKDKADLFSVLTILKAISAKRRAHDILFVFVEHISKVVPSDRCSIVRIWGGDPNGNVMASHEDASVVNRTIELYKYPELGHSMNTQRKILINDALAAKSDESFAQELRKAGINSLVVIPIVLFDQHVGSLLLRAARLEGNFTPREVSFFEIVAEAASNALERAQLFESIQVANERLERLAITDGLTGLYNHRHFRDHLQKEFDRASRYKLPLACMIFDVDDFKSLNDTYGHLAGDRVLKEIAERAQRSVRKSDLLARYGGEEFVIIMAQTGCGGAEVEGERIRSVIADAPFSDVSTERSVTISGGISVLDHETMLNPEDLLRAADQALYEAKRGGKNKVVLSPGKGSK